MDLYNEQISIFFAIFESSILILIIIIFVFLKLLKVILYPNRVKEKFIKPNIIAGNNSLTSSESAEHPHDLTHHLCFCFPCISCSPRHLMRKLCCQESVNVLECLVFTNFYRHLCAKLHHVNVLEQPFMEIRSQSILFVVHYRIKHLSQQMM